ncbi:inorganic diphosphatase [Gammaproteobacteria bacterium]|nr:inorganic diphosphatase [Gammaproteobacteria bacterium]
MNKQDTMVVDVIVETTPQTGPVKYEICKDTGHLRVDRFLETAMNYPCLYGYIPGTLCDDGDACDILVLTHHTVLPGSVLEAQPVGMLMMEDEAGLDNKIIAVPSGDLSKDYSHINDIGDVPKSMIAQIEHFFKHYKDLNPNKWVKISDWKDAAAARAEIEKSKQSI